ncbi:alpha/beta hydrolase [Denitratisoma sp. agr-D3]
MDALTSLLDTMQDNVRRVAVEKLAIPGFAAPLAARLYRPVGIAGPMPVVLYFHGGGFVGGSLDDAHLPALFIARYAALAVVAVAYSLAPAHPFPAAPEDGFAAADWLRRQGREHGIDGQRLALAGDDAGGNLAAALGLMLKDRNAPPALAQVLVGAMLDPSMTRQGDARQLGSDLSAETCNQCYAQYLPKPMQRLHPYAAPLESSRLRGLPPALIATAECDVLHRESEQYAAALIAAGVPTQVTRFPVKHGELPTYPPLLNEVAEFLRRRLVPAAPALEAQF